MEYKYDSYYEKNIPYKMTLEELFERGTSYEGKNAFYTDEDFLAYLRSRGEKFRCYARSAVRGIPTPLGMMCSSNDEEYVLCRLVTGKDSERYNDSSYNPLIENSIIPRDGSWYCGYKLGITPAEFNGVLDSYYVSDFVSLINEGHIQIWEPLDGSEQS